MDEPRAADGNAHPAPAAAVLTIERVVPGGAGLGRVDGVVALVEGGLPGDRVRAELAVRQPGLLTGRVVEVLEPGPHRRPAAEVCPRARDGACGGCDWPAARLSSEAELKTALVLDALRRVGRLPPGVVSEPRFLASPRAYRLRNRFHLEVRGGAPHLGFLAPRSHRVADLAPCELISTSLRDRLPALAAALAPAAPAELVTLEGRAGTPILGELRSERPLTGAFMAAIFAGVRGLLDGLRLSTPAGVVEEGATSLDIVAGGASFRVSVSSFFQGNRHLLDAFLGEARAAVAACAKVRHALDLYAGVGFLTRPLVEAASEVTAVEVAESSARDLALNLEAWRREGLAPSRAVRATAEAFLRRPLRGVDLVTLDPPRQGMAREVLRALLRLRPRALLLVSCDPATFARDVAQLVPRYRMERLVLLDLFPGTHHVELLSLLLLESP